VTQLLRNWQYTGQLCLSLYERAARFRLTVLIPAILHDRPFITVDNENFFETLEAVQNWKVVSAKANVRFGIPRSFEEATTCIRLIASENVGLNEGMRGLLTTHPRCFIQSKVLPVLLSNTFNTEQTIFDAITEGYMSLILLGDNYQSSENPDKPVRKYTSTNLHMAIRAFPAVNRRVRLSLNLD
jgi:hypothetical protein